MAPFRTLCGAAASVAIVTMASAAVISAANQPGFAATGWQVLVAPIGTPD